MTFRIKLKSRCLPLLIAACLLSSVGTQLGCSKDTPPAAENAQLDQELQELREVNAELQRLRAENQELSRLQRDNEEVRRLREQTADLPKLQEENLQLRSELQALKAPKPKR